MLTLKASRNNVPAAKTNEIYVVASIQTPAIAGTGTKRSPIHAAVAIDVSGSMGDSTNARINGRYANKMEVAKFTLEKMVENMTEDDYLSIVSFTGNIRDVVINLQMDVKGKTQALREISRLYHQDSTNLGEGLHRALCHLTDDRKGPKVIRRAFLFTDGQANAGRWPRTENILNMLKDFQDASISSFGFGHDAQADFLSSAARGGGAYYFIDDAEKIPTAFGTEFGALTSLYAKEVVMDINRTDEVEKVEVLNDLKVVGGPSSPHIHVECHDLLAEQKYDVVLKVTTRKRRIVKTPQEILSVDVRMSPIATGGKLLAPTAVASLGFVGLKNADKSDDVEVMKAVAVQEAAKAAKEAKVRADRGDLLGARQTLNDAATRTRKLGHEVIAKSLIGTVGEYESQARYRARGAGMTMSYASTLSSQRGSTGGQMYGDVKVDTLFNNAQQKKMANAFAITADTSGDDDMPNVDEMVTE